MIILKHTDGSIAIMELAPGADKEYAIQQFKAHHEGQYVEQYEGNFKVPESRKYRDAWTLSKLGSIIIDKAKAKLIDAAELLSSDNIESRVKALEDRLNETEK